MDDFERAHASFQRALDIKKRDFGENSEDVAYIYEGIAMVYTKQLDYKNALTYLNKALAIIKVKQGENSTHIKALKEYIKSLKENME